MGTPFIQFLGPTRGLDSYQRGVPHDQQAPGIPQVFCDAMEVREEVFVKEQGVPADNEFDADDPRSCHWVVYASVNKTEESEVLDDAGNVVRPRKSVTRSTPVGTVRVVPFPHAPHPKIGGVYWDGVLQEVKDLEGGTRTRNAADVEGGVEGAEHVGKDGEERRLSASRPTFTTDRATTFHDGKEPYVKLGRLAVAKEFRGHRIAKLLVSAALEWLRTHPSYFNPSVLELGLEQMGATNEKDIPKWNGLVCVHAQQQVIGAWAKFGFQVDEGMGTWTEEGIPHVGMFLRLETVPEPVRI